MLAKKNGQRHRIQSAKYSQNTHSQSGSHFTFSFFSSIFVFFVVHRKERTNGGGGWNSDISRNYFSLFKIFRKLRTLNYFAESVPENVPSLGVYVMTQKFFSGPKHFQWSMTKIEEKVAISFTSFIILFIRNGMEAKIYNIFTGFCFQLCRIEQRQKW